MKRSDLSKNNNKTKINVKQIIVIAMGERLNILAYASIASFRRKQQQKETQDM